MNKHFVLLERAPDLPQFHLTWAGPVKPEQIGFTHEVMKEAYGRVIANEAVKLMADYHNYKFPIHVLSEN